MWQKVMGAYHEAYNKVTYEVSQDCLDPQLISKNGTNIIVN